MAIHALDVRLAELARRLTAQMGLGFPVQRWPDLERAVNAAAPELGFADAQECLETLVRAPVTRRQIEILAGYLTIGETYFFRDKAGFQYLQEHVLPELIRAHRGAEQRLRIWCAGCCTGEEPYSLAIVLRQLLPDLDQWQLSILGTDINRSFLRKAAAGVYSVWSFRAAPPALKRTSFTPVGAGKWQLRPEIRRMVTFGYLNLAEDVYPALLNGTNALDLIVCRNVLMYFAAPQVALTIARFTRALVDGGWLMLGAAEVPAAFLAPLSRTRQQAAGFYQKKGGGTAEPQRSGALPVRRPAGLHGGRSISARWPAPAQMPPVAAERPRAVAGAAAVETACTAARVLYEQGQYGAAAATLSPLAAGPRPAAAVLGLLARIHANQGALGAALAYCTQVLEADKLNPVWHYLSATILQEQGQPAAAAAALQRALYLAPDFVLAHFALGNLCRQQGDGPGTRRHLLNARALLERYRPEDPLPESDGILAGRLAEIIEALTLGG